jgi:hypothetical protein
MLLLLTTTALLSTISTTDAVDYFKASCTPVPAGTVSLFNAPMTISQVIGPANTCLVVSSLHVKCTGCGSSANCTIYDDCANSVKASNQSLAAYLTCDENTPGTDIQFQKFVDDNTCSGTRKFFFKTISLITLINIGLIYAFNSYDMIALTFIFSPSSFGVVLLFSSFDWQWSRKMALGNVSRHVWRAWILCYQRKHCKL